MSGEMGSHITWGCQGPWACLCFQVEQESGERVTCPRIAEMGSLPTLSPCSRSDKARTFSELPADRYHADAGRKILTQRNGRMLMCAVILCVCMCVQETETVSTERFLHSRPDTDMNTHISSFTCTSTYIHTFIYTNMHTNTQYTNTYTDIHIHKWFSHKQISSASSPNFFLSMRPHPPGTDRSNSYYKETGLSSMPDF